ncbi:hypothetical protein N2152v2_010348 [Parachlorella kessleri]
MPPRKRTRAAEPEARPAEAAASDDHEQAQSDLQAAAPPPAVPNNGGQPGEGRRTVMAAVARRRAAHFAKYEDEEDGQEEGDNVHVGGTQARNLGMWSSAVELVNAREQARQKRQEALLHGDDADRPQQPAVHWVPSRDVRLGPRPKNSVPPLFELAMKLVVRYIEDVESLWGIPDVVKGRIAAAVCCRRRLSPMVVKLFTEEGPSELVLPDCTQIQADCMQELLLACATTRQVVQLRSVAAMELVKLDLGLCGRSLTDDTAATFAGAIGGYPAATSLRLSGAYCLSDKGLVALLRGMRSLHELSLPQCSRLAGPALEQLPSLVPNLRHLDLDECRGLAEHTIGAALVGLSRLESVVLNGIPEVSDTLLARLSCCPQLLRLSLCHCSAVTDNGVAAIALALPGLLELRLNECTKVTSRGVLSLAGRCKSIQDVSLRRLTRIDEEGLVKLAEGGTLRSLSLHGMTQVEGPALAALALYCKDTLQELDVSWCRKLSNEALGHLVDSCRSLRRLSVWGCSQLTDTFLLGHSNEALEVVGMGEQLLSVPKI